MKKSFLHFAVLVMTFCVLAGCKGNNSDPVPAEKAADLIVYGSIYTVEDDTPQVEAFAVKDGKYIYVGDVNGAKAFLGEKTVVIDRRGKGMVTPGFADSHSHYLMSEAMTSMGSLQFDEKTTPEDLLKKVAAEYAKAKTTGAAGIYGFGWVYQFFEKNMPTVEDFEKVCPDIPLYLSDSEGHKGLANKMCLLKAGLINADGTRTAVTIKGGEVEVKDGKATGLLKEQAGTYCKLRGLDFNQLLDEAKAIDAVANACHALISNGYTLYQDGWSNYYGNNRFYEAAQKLDEGNNLGLYLCMAYEVESSSTNPKAEFEKAFDTKKFASTHINPKFIKIFIDGTVETFTGYVKTPYKDGTYGIPNWTTDDLVKYTKFINDNDYTVHAHAMGDAGVHQGVEAFVASGKKEKRNTLVHVRNVLTEDFKVMATNNIVVTSGFIWHFATEMSAKYFHETLPEKYANEMYPIKSYFDNGVVMSGHTDYPALSGASPKPLYMIETSCTGQQPGDNSDPVWPSELITRKQALKAMTLNGAYQMHVEKERGSIKVGKYADFVLFDKDVMNESVPVRNIHTANLIATYFEGELVYEQN